MKEKLLQLINVCLENPTFFEYLDKSHFADKEIKEKITIDRKYYFDKINIYVDNSWQNTDNEPRALFLKNKNIEYGIDQATNTVKYPAQSLKITFSDMPTIFIFVETKSNDLEKGEIELDELDHRKVQNHWYSFLLDGDYDYKWVKTGKKVIQLLQ